MSPPAENLSASSVALSIPGIKSKLLSTAPRALHDLTPAKSSASFLAVLTFYTYSQWTTLQVSEHAILGFAPGLLHTTFPLPGTSFTHHLFSCLASSFSSLRLQLNSFSLRHIFYSFPYLWCLVQHLEHNKSSKDVCQMNEWMLPTHVAVCKVVFEGSWQSWSVLSFMGGKPPLLPIHKYPHCTGLQLL